VIVEGHAGMGKSALLGEFARRLPDGALLVQVSGAEPESRLPFGWWDSFFPGWSRWDRQPRGVLLMPRRTMPLATGAGLVQGLPRRRVPRLLGFVTCLPVSPASCRFRGCGGYRWGRRRSRQTALRAQKRASSHP